MICDIMKMPKLISYDMLRQTYVLHSPCRAIANGSLYFCISMSNLTQNARKIDGIQG